jgi:hypothetical protein
MLITAVRLQVKEAVAIKDYTDYEERGVESLLCGTMPMMVSKGLPSCDSSCHGGGGVETSRTNHALFYRF